MLDFGTLIFTNMRGLWELCAKNECVQHDLCFLTYSSTHTHTHTHTHTMHTLWFVARKQPLSGN